MGPPGGKVRQVCVPQVHDRRVEVGGASHWGKAGYGHDAKRVAAGREPGAEVAGALPQLPAAAHTGSVQGLDVVGDGPRWAAVLCPA